MRSGARIAWARSREVGSRVALWSWAIFVAWSGVACGGSRDALPDEPPLADLALAESALGVPTPEAAAMCAALVPEGAATLLRAALEGNVDLAVARERLAAAETMIVQARAGRLPQVDAQVGVGRQRVPTFNPLTGRDATSQTQFQASVPVAWEIDLWGRVGAQVEAAERDVLAGWLDVEGARLSLAGQLVDLWWQRGAALERRRLLDEQEETARVLLDLVTHRLRMGSATLLDLTQQRQQLEAIEAQRVRVDLAVTLLEQRLALLQGRVPGSVALPPAGPWDIDALWQAEDLPALLLDARPDVRAARLRAEAADARVRVAMAARLPALRLSASVSLQAQSLGELVDFVFWSVASSLSGPLFDGGRRRAEVERQEALLREALLQWGGVFLAAVAEVEGALAEERDIERLLASVYLQRADAELALDLARAQWRAGLLDFLRVLSAQQALQALDQSLLDLLRDQRLQRLRVCRSLALLPLPSED